MRDCLERDLDMLEMLSVATKEAIRLKFALTKRGFDSWLHRIRERRRESRIYLNKILSLEKRNPRLRKILASASEQDLDLINDPELL